MEKERESQNAIRKKIEEETKTTGDLKLLKLKYEIANTCYRQIAYLELYLYLYCHYLILNITPLACANNHTFNFSGKTPADDNNHTVNSQPAEDHNFAFPMI